MTTQLPVMPLRTIHLTIEATPDAVYAFCSDPRNLPRWIPSFAKSVERAGDRWRVHTVQGDVYFTFVPTNSLGVLDHHVTDDAELAVYNPLRVIANGPASEVIFTLFRRPGVTDEAYDQDAADILGDLTALKQILETKR